MKPAPQKTPETEGYSKGPEPALRISVSLTAKGWKTDISEWRVVHNTITMVFTHVDKDGETITRRIKRSTKPFEDPVCMMNDLSGVSYRLYCYPGQEKEIEHLLRQMVAHNISRKKSLLDDIWTIAQKEGVDRNLTVDMIRESCASTLRKLAVKKANGE